MALTSDDLKAIQNIVWHSDIDLAPRTISAGTALLALLDRPAVSIDVDALATAIAAKVLAGLPTTDPSGITVAQVRQAVHDAFAGGLAPLPTT